MNDLYCAKPAVLVMNQCTFFLGFQHTNTQLNFENGLIKREWLKKSHKNDDLRRNNILNVEHIPFVRIDQFRHSLTDCIFYIAQLDKRTKLFFGLLQLLCALCFFWL